MKFASPEHVAEMLDLSVPTVRRWIRSGKLLSVKLGHVVRVDLDAMNEQFGLSEAVSKKPSRDHKRAERERLAARAALSG